MLLEFSGNSFVLNSLVLQRVKLILVKSRKEALFPEMTGKYRKNKVVNLGP